MVGQLLFYLLLYLLGLLVTIDFRTKENNLLLISFLALPIGVALWIFGVAFSLILPMKSSIFSIFAIVAILVFLYYKFLRPRESRVTVRKKEIIGLAVLFIGYVIVCAIIVSRNAVNTSPDSFAYLLYGDYIARFGELNKSIVFIERISVPTILSMAGILHVDYLGNIFPILSVSFLGVFGCFIWKSSYFLGHKHVERIIISALGILLLGTSYNYIYHSFYIGTNLFATVYFSIAFLSMFMYFQERKRHWIVISSVTLAVFSLTRPEGIVFIFIILILYFCQMKNQKEAFLFVIPFVVLSYPWHFYIIRYQGLTRYSLEKVLSFLVIFVALAIIIYRYNDFQKIKKYITKIGLFLLLGIVILLIFLEPKTVAHIIKTYSILIFEKGRWGITPYFFIIVAIFLSFLDRQVKYNVLVYGILYYGLSLIVIFTRYDSTYTIKPGYFGSANRVMLGILPLVIFYIIVNLGCILSNKLSKFYEKTSLS